MQKSKSLNPIRLKIQFQLEFNFASHILSNFLIFVASESYIYIYIERERETHTHTHKYLFTYNISCEYLFQSVFTNKACEIMYIAC